MVSVTKHISLHKIKCEDHKKLWDLMIKVYTNAYQHLWKDSGKWYLNKMWSFNNLKKELQDRNARYYFINFEEKCCGILRVVENALFHDKKDLKLLKLHRLYLDEVVQGKGVGKAVMLWSEAYAEVTGHQGVWLEAMDTKTQALKFYQSCGYHITSDFRLDFQLMHPHFRGMHRMYKALEKQ